MSAQNFVSIGFTRKTHGVKGELKCSIEEAFEEIAVKKGRVFLDIKGRKVPYFIESLRGAGEPIVKFEDVDNREQAMLLQSRELFLSESDLPRGFEVEEEEGLVYEHIKGYHLIDKTQGDLGIISEVIEMPQQEMAVLHYLGKEIMVPLNEHFIVSIDDDQRKVLADLPEGLLDM
ncbi:MAG TPA: ribosome maturation factor RimM [Saprospiraceae bacterium]|nr:ribosome maturation factor RimM [Saprospiraceae bacterium]